MRSSPGSLKKGEEATVVVSVTHTVFSSLAGGAAVKVSPGTGVLMQVRFSTAVFSPVATSRAPRDLVIVLIALLSGVCGPARVVPPFLVMTLVLGLYRCIVVAFYVAVLLSAFARWVSRSGVDLI